MGMASTIGIESRSSFQRPSSRLVRIFPRLEKSIEHRVSQKPPSLHRGIFFFTYGCPCVFSTHSYHPLRVASFGVIRILEVVLKKNVQILAAHGCCLLLLLRTTGAPLFFVCTSRSSSLSCAIFQRGTGKERLVLFSRRFFVLTRRLSSRGRGAPFH